MSGDERRNVGDFGVKMYVECAKDFREFGARVLLSVVAALVIWIVGQFVFIPIAEGLKWAWIGYPITEIIGFIIVVALAIIIFKIFMDIRRLARGLAGVLAYEFGKASGEFSRESIEHYRTAIDGILYVIIVALVYLLFANYLAMIHEAIPAVLLILIVIWSVVTLWRSSRAVAAEAGKYAARWAEELEKRVRGK